MSKHVTASRRAVLVGLAAAPSMSAAAIGCEVDPIFAVIEEHEAAYKLVVEAEQRQDQIEKTLPEEKTRTNFSVYAPELIESDDPAWIAAGLDWFASHRRYHAAQWALADTPPATAAGLWALLAYLNQHQERERPRFGDDCVHYAWPERRIGTNVEEDKDCHQWAVCLFATLAKAGQRLAV